jgi:hypothetical protein
MTRRVVAVALAAVLAGIVVAGVHQGPPHHEVIDCANNDHPACHPRPTPPSRP